jgi:YD repeat-containing protein
MRCPHCSSELPPGQAACPHCGTLAVRQSFGGRSPGLLIVLCFLGLFTVAGSACYFLAQSGFFVKVLAHFDQRRGPHSVPVEHGGLVRPGELEKYGKLYFIPMGRQAIPVQSLADYYLGKFNLEITILPEVPLEAGDCMPERRKCIAEEMILTMKRTYPGLAKDPDSVMIILTDEDIFPRSLGWDFTYSFHAGYRFGIVSTRRTDPAFWGDPPDDAERMASTRQMLTKYIALMYFHVPISYDPSSVMYQPLTPNGGPDDLYQSDIHSEESANGLRGSGWPCLRFTYSYETGELRSYSASATACDYLPQVRSAGEEAFDTQLGLGEFVEHAMDFQLDSTPYIEFRRAYLSQYVHGTALGFGGNHNYNTWLYSDGAAKLSFMDIIHEDGARDHLERLSPGRGFSAGVVFESHDDAEEIYGARMTWDSGHFKLQFRDGSWSTYLPCGDGRCYWTGYQDAKGNSLHIERAANLDLQRVASEDGQAIAFQSDVQHRIVDATDSRGTHVSYDYDGDGCLAQVHRADGQTTLYEYTPGHRMTSISVLRRPGETPRRLVTNEYDAQGRVVRETLLDGSVYEMEYGPVVDGHISRVKLKEPSGRVLYITLTRSDYIARTDSIRFPVRTARR